MRYAEGASEGTYAGSDVFTGEIRWDFKDDVADVEDGQDRVIVVSLQPKVFLETS